MKELHQSEKQNIHQRFFFVFFEKFMYVPPPTEATKIALSLVKQAEM